MNRPAAIGQKVRLRKPYKGFEYGVVIEHRSGIRGLMLAVHLDKSGTPVSGPVTIDLFWRKVVPVGGKK